MSNQTYTLVDPVTHRVVEVLVAEAMKNKRLGSDNTICNFYRTDELATHVLGQIIDIKKGTAVDYIYTMTDFRVLYKEAFRLSDIVALRIMDGSLPVSNNTHAEHTEYRAALRSLYKTYVVSESINWPEKPTLLESKL